MKFGLFQSLKLKQEKYDLNANGLFLKSFSFNIKYQPKPTNKVIFIVKKKIGNSPARNRIKRQIRAILSNTSFLKKTIHLMIIVKIEIQNTEFQSLKLELEKILKKISISK